MKKPKGFENAFYGRLLIPCYYKDETFGGGELQGRNWIFDKILDIILWLDVNVWGIEDFKILLETDKE